MEDVKVRFAYGALAHTLEEQANQQGYTLGKEADRLEKLKKARAILFVHGIINDSEAERTAKKINQKVIDALSSLE